MIADRCATCRFWQPLELEGFVAVGECRRRAPTIAAATITYRTVAVRQQTVRVLCDGAYQEEQREEPIESPVNRLGWGVTNAIDWCGEHEKAPWEDGMSC